MGLKMASLENLQGQLEVFKSLKKYTLKKGYSGLSVRIIKDCVIDKKIKDREERIKKLKLSRITNKKS